MTACGCVAPDLLPHAVLCPLSPRYVSATVPMPVRWTGRDRRPGEPVPWSNPPQAGA